jgi:hypothetical protein
MIVYVAFVFSLLPLSVFSSAAGPGPEDPLPPGCTAATTKKTPKLKKSDECNQRRTRSLMEKTFTKRLYGDEPEVQDYLDACGAYSYEGLIYVDSHLHAVASPGEEAVNAGCPFIIAHSVFDDLTSPAYKEVLIWDDKEQGEAVVKGGSLSIGTFKLADIAQAYQQASPNAKGAKAYNIMTNNCGNFVVNLASLLGVKVDSKLTSFVSRRLLAKSGTVLFDRLRSSIADFSGRHLRHEDEATNKDLVERLVDSQASVLN